MADITSLEGLNDSLFSDGSFSDFINSVEAALLDNPDFIEALNEIDPALLTDGRFTSFLSAVGSDIILDGSFVEFAALISRSLLSDGSFTAFLNGVDRSVLTDGDFTETLLTLGEDILSNGNFTEALLSLNENILKSPAFQEALSLLGEAVLTSDGFEAAFGEGLLPGVEDSIEITDDGVVIIDGIEVSGADIADTIQDQLSEIQDTLTGTIETVSQDALLTGGSRLQASDMEQTAAFFSLSESGTNAAVDTELRDFINGETQLLLLEQSVEPDLAGMGAGGSLGNGEGDLLLASGELANPLEHSLQLVTDGDIAS